MIPNDVLNQLQYLVKTSAPPLLEVAEHPTDLPEWVPGQKVDAFVLSVLPNGRFQVQVSDLSLDMNLPKNTQPGENVELTVVSTAPRLTFALSRDLETAGARADKSPVSLSDTARFIGGLLQRMSQMEGEEGVAAAQKAVPLLTGAPEDVPEFAVALRNAVTHSGLFYESHQAEWVSGQRPLADLLAEPQGRLSLRASAEFPSAAGLVPAAGQMSTEETAQETATVAASAAASAHAGGVEGKEEKISPATLPLIRQQLDALDTRQMVWQGMVWPDQQLHWEIEEDDPRREEGGGDDNQRWKTRLRLIMPRLGDVAASLTLGAHGVGIELRVANPQTGERLQDAQPALSAAFAAAGLPLTSFAVGLVHEPLGPEA